MSKARSRRLLTLSLVAALLMAGLLGTVDASPTVDEQHLTTGHSEFAEASTTFDSCFAGLAGHLLQRVTWFNGNTLFTHSDGGDKHIYVTEHLTKDDGEFNKSTGFKVQDPSQQQLYRTDNTYKFTDENDKSDDPKQWIVREYFELRERKEIHKVPDNDEEDQSVNAGEQTTMEKFYVFVVETGSTRTDGTLDKDYNFAMVVDTCRFYSGPTGTTSHNGTSGESGAVDAQHEETDGEHPHDRFSIDIWVGGEPTTLAGGSAQVPDDRDGNSSTEDDAKNGEP